MTDASSRLQPLYSVFCVVHLTLVTPTTRAGGGGWHENLNRPDVETGGELRAVLHKREHSQYCRVIYCFYYGFTCYNGIMASPGHPGVTPSLLLLGVVRRLEEPDTLLGDARRVYFHFIQTASVLWSYGVIMEMILSVRQFTGYFILALFMSEHCNKHYRADLLRPRWSPSSPGPSSVVLSLSESSKHNLESFCLLAPFPCPRSVFTPWPVVMVS